MRFLSSIVLALAVFLVSPAAFAADKDKIAALCTADSNLPPTNCACVGEAAENELTADERALLVAILERNQAESTRLRSSLPLESVMKAGMFMTHAPAGCAQK